MFDPTSWMVGAASTAVGSWLTFKVHVYQEARVHHREELKQHVLQPLRSAIEGLHLHLTFSVEWQQQSLNRNASASEMPVKFGPALNINDPGLISDNSVEPALLEDARANHYPKLIAGWDKLRSSWFAHLDRRMKLIEELAQSVIDSSGLEAHPAKDPNGQYVMHLALAMFVYSRLMGLGDRALNIEVEPNCAYLTDGGQRVAKSTPDQVRRVLQIADSLIQSHAARASQLNTELATMVAARSALLHQFSLAIAAKRLSRRCELVPFF